MQDGSSTYSDWTHGDIAYYRYLYPIRNSGNSNETHIFATPAIYEANVRCSNDISSVQTFFFPVIKSPLLISLIRGSSYVYAGRLNTFCMNNSLGGVFSGSSLTTWAVNTSAIAASMSTGACSTVTFTAAGVVQLTATLASATVTRVITVQQHIDGLSLVASSTILAVGQNYSFATLTTAGSSLSYMWSSNNNVIASATTSNITLAFNSPAIQPQLPG